MDDIIVSPVSLGEEGVISIQVFGGESPGFAVAFLHMAVVSIDRIDVAGCPAIRVTCSPHLKISLDDIDDYFLNNGFMSVNCLSNRSLGTNTICTQNYLYIFDINYLSNFA